MKKVLLGLTFLVFLSCNKDDGDALIKQESGEVWLSSGLAHCAEQIHLDNGAILIVNIEDIKTFESGDRVEKTLTLTILLRHIQTISFS